MAHRSYVFTVFGVEGAAQQLVDDLGGTAGVRYVVGQLEQCPTSQRMHLQGYIELRNPVRMPGLKALFGAYVPHVEPRKGSRDDARAYCRKADTRIAGPWECGDWAGGGAGKRNDIAALKAAIDGGADDTTLWDDQFGTMLRHHRAVNTYRVVRANNAHPRDSVDVHVYWGPTGTGKTHRAHAEAGESYVLPRSDGSVWFDGYVGQRSLIIDEFYGWLRWDMLLRILDKYKMLVPIKGGFVNASWTAVYITSNKHPKDWYCAEKCGPVDPLYRRITTITRMDIPHAAPPVPI